MVERYKRQPGDIKRLKSIKADEYKADVAKLHTLRLAATLTQRALGVLLHESQTYIANVERRVRRIDAYEARCWEQACREHTAKEAVRRALEMFASLDAAARAARSTVANGASTSQPKGLGLPLAADALHGGPPAAAVDDSATVPCEARRTGTPARRSRTAPGPTGGKGLGAGSREKPKRG